MLELTKEPHNLGLRMIQDSLEEMNRMILERVPNAYNTGLFNLMILSSCSHLWERLRLKKHYSQTK